MCGRNAFSLVNLPGTTLSTTFLPLMLPHAGDCQNQPLYPQSLFDENVRSLASRSCGKDMPELAVPGYNYLGPGNALNKGGPVNEVDWVAQSVVYPNTVKAVA